MVRNIFFVLILSTGFIHAQNESYIQPGLLSATATLGPSKMLARNSSNYYLSGFAEYFIEKNLSLRGDIFLYASSDNDVPFISEAARSFFGLSYHLNKNNFDVHFGFQPGITYMKRNPYSDGNQTFAPVEEDGQLMPSFTLSCGATYYVWKYFNFFVNLNYVRSELHGTRSGSFNTDELIFSAGLGFQIQTRRAK